MAAERHRVVISIGRLGNATAPADYYLERRPAVRSTTTREPGERRGTWIGRGAAELGLAGELTGKWTTPFGGCWQDEALTVEYSSDPSPGLTRVGALTRGP